MNDAMRSRIEAQGFLGLDDHFTARGSWFCIFSTHILIPRPR
jgi:hypothetical protein